MLSSRLKAFVMPISQTTPMIVARTLLLTISTRTPEARTSAAAAPLARLSFASGDR